VTSNNNQFHYRHPVFSLQLRSKVGHILGKDTVLCINLNIDEVNTQDCRYTFSIAYSLFTLSNISVLNLVSYL
jgi:hypothetical protein